MVFVFIFAFYCVYDQKRHSNTWSFSSPPLWCRVSPTSNIYDVRTVYAIIYSSVAVDVLTFTLKMIANGAVAEVSIIYVDYKFFRIIASVIIRRVSIIIVLRLEQFKYK